MKIAKLISFTDATAIDVGYLPPNSIITAVKVIVGTPFDATTTNLVDVGISTDPDKFANDVDVSSAGQASVTQLNTGVIEDATESTLIQATYAQSGTAATAGSGYVVVEYAQL